MATIVNWLPALDETGNFEKESGWNIILKEIYLVLMTPQGSRCWQPTFGTRIHEYLFEHDDKKVEIENEIKNSFKWLPHVKLVSCVVTMIPLSGRSGSAAHVNLVIEWNNSRLPMGITIPSTLDDIDGSIYNVGMVQNS